MCFRISNWPILEFKTRPTYYLAKDNSSVYAKDWTRPNVNIDDEKLIDLLFASNTLPKIANRTAGLEFHVNSNFNKLKILRLKFPLFSIVSPVIQSISFCGLQIQVFFTRLGFKLFVKACWSEGCLSSTITSLWDYWIH